MGTITTTESPTVLEIGEDITTLEITETFNQLEVLPENCDLTLTDNINIIEVTEDPITLEVILNQTDLSVADVVQTIEVLDSQIELIEIAEQGPPGTDGLGLDQFSANIAPGATVAVDSLVRAQFVAAEWTVSHRDLVNDFQVLKQYTSNWYGSGIKLIQTGIRGKDSINFSTSVVDNAGTIELRITNNQPNTLVITGTRISVPI